MSFYAGNFLVILCQKWNSDNIFDNVILFYLLYFMGILITVGKILHMFICDFWFSKTIQWWRRPKDSWRKLTISKTTQEWCYILSWGFWEMDHPAAISSGTQCPKIYLMYRISSFFPCITKFAKMLKICSIFNLLQSFFCDFQIFLKKIIQDIIVAYSVFCDL